MFSGTLHISYYTSKPIFEYLRHSCRINRTLHQKNIHQLLNFWAFWEERGFLCASFLLKMNLQMIWGVGSFSAFRLELVLVRTGSYESKKVSGRFWTTQISGFGKSGGSGCSTLVLWSSSSASGGANSATAGDNNWDEWGGKCATERGALNSRLTDCVRVSYSTMYLYFVFVLVARVMPSVTP